MTKKKEETDSEPIYALIKSIPKPMRGFLMGVLIGAIASEMTKKK